MPGDDEQTNPLHGEETRNPDRELLILIALGMVVLPVALFALLALIDATFFG